MSGNYQHRLDRLRQALRDADTVLIGGGAGLSAAAGLTYGGARFQSLFPDFIARYGMGDMYSAGFYAFNTQEEKWGYWSRHIMVNRYDPGPCRIYSDLLKLVENKKYFVITTNADAQFFKSGFGRERIFAVQGDYGKFQCAMGCHRTLYGNEKMVGEMMAAQKDCRIPSHLIPKCPRCGGNMEPNIRKDGFFVEDRAWHEAADRYERFVAGLGGSSVALLELGIGYNTPSIIKFPFEQITAQTAMATLVRINRDYPEINPENGAKTIAFGEDIRDIISALSSFAR